MGFYFKHYKILIISVFIVVLILIGIVHLFQDESEGLSHSPCLIDDEFADYEIDKKGVARGIANIFIKDKNTGEIISEFQIENTFPNHYHPYEAHGCGIYIIREFNFDSKKYKPMLGFSVELWKYQYNGAGKEILIFADEDDFGKPTVHYSYDFRIDFQEKYIALMQSYLGQPDYALVIKNLETKEDVFVLSLKDITNKHPSLEGNIDLKEWTKDGQYFWGRTHLGAYTLGFFRIDATNWNVDIFEAPEGVLGGSALNIEKGYVTRHPGHEWTGIDVITEQVKQEWREQGKVSSLYLYDLFTKEETLLATTDEPLWFFQPKWISDRELEYELPSGEKKIYTIQW